MVARKIVWSFIMNIYIEKTGQGVFWSHFSSIFTQKISLYMIYEMPFVKGKVLQRYVVKEALVLSIHQDLC
jgi:hypothetical protein